MTTTTPSSTGGTSGITPHIAALLCYLLMLPTCGFPVAGIVFIVIEKQQPAVRFHAWQSVLLGGAAWASSMLLWILEAMAGRLFGPLGLLLGLIRLGVGLVWLAVWIICVIKAYGLETWRVPYLGDLAARQAERPS